eukprot:3761460-Amphidinium_carterae.1
MRWLVIVKAWSRLRKPCKLDEGCPKDAQRMQQRLGTEALNALLPGQRSRWMKAHLKQVDVDSGRVTVDDFQAKQADLLANEGTAQHGPLEPDPVWLTWQDFAMK